MVDSDVPACPACGGPMVLRTATKGKNPGGQFYGCKSYPKCEATVSLNAVDGPFEVFLPRLMIAGPASDSVQTRFFQTIGLPAEFVRAAYEDEVDDNDEETRRTLIRAASQWRLDYPVAPLGPVSPDLRRILAVAESILTRGSLTPSSPNMEEALGNLTHETAWKTSALDTLHKLAFKRTTSVHGRLDSDEERLFIEWFDGLQRTDAGGWRIISQPHFHSLVTGRNAEANERIDFLLTSPFEIPIVVEIDGEQHTDHQAVDRGRDQALRAAGYEVYRISAREMREGRGPLLTQLKSRLAAIPGARDDATGDALFMDIARFVHQVELVTLEAMRSGRLSPEKTLVQIAPPKALCKHASALEIIAHAPNDVIDLVNHLGDLYGVSEAVRDVEVQIIDDPDVSEGVVVASVDSRCFSNSDPLIRSNWYTISQTYVPFDMAMPLHSVPPIRIPAPSRQAAEWFLHYIFRKKEFKEGQWDAIERCLQGKDSVVLLPTGAGKSIAFQLASLLLPGTCLVIDPILALIDDQIDNLRLAGIDRCAGITSAIGPSKDALQVGVAKGHYLFCYIAPERLQMQPFRDTLTGLTSSGVPISLITVDEAHCVSEWGHDFRTSYLNLGRIARQYGASQNVIPPLIALTGTASRIVLKDVQRELQVTDFDAIITPSSFDRKNLFFNVIACALSGKNSAVTGFIGGLPSRFGVSNAHFFGDRSENALAGLVFCPHVNGSYGVVELAGRIEKVHPTAAVGYYAGAAPKSWKGPGWNEQKNKTARKFKRNRLNLLACTSAFGMGIDKPNIRYTMHLGLPDSIEEFYQEAGRAGRGGESDTSYCGIVLSDDYPRRSRRLLDPGTPIDEIRREVKATSYSDSDDVIRSLYFHIGSFRGHEEDKRDIRVVLNLIGNIDHSKTQTLSWREGQIPKERLEKALHRLVVLDVIDDYTVNYASQEFLVRLSGATQVEVANAFGAYAGSYQTALADRSRERALSLRSTDHAEFVAGVADLLVDFIYDHIELARRRSLSEMLDAARSADDGEKLRKRILDYLTATEFDDRLAEVRESASGGLEALDPILVDVVSSKEAESLRGAVAQYLSSYPDIPGLLLLRACSEALSRDSEETVVEENAAAAIRYAIDVYQFPSEFVGEACGRTLGWLQNKEGSADMLLRHFMEAQQVNRDFVRGLLKAVPYEYAALPAQWLSENLAIQTDAMLQTGK